MYNRDQSIAETVREVMNYPMIMELHLIKYSLIWLSFERSKE